ncbi:MAG: CDP-alcohol phosphatidyltransferase family protein [Candidatus Palauibacterales bacterium]|nr:CDP-alcohol phosphatidyltransferase family protein [Candidatus Palauibacterales bacterium]MDP2530150.1 CDP-alcohol phosphatidyltransferase family protein [Candidatus Palauibacterales bacterium]MDP2582539.1 CDP-alcohol phosphatidyltransferase family protein [Candidatus Palauibacterales bacterium]
MIWNLPNAITTLRVLLAPLLAFLLLEPGATARALGFGVFLVAAISDLWDGYLARRRHEITDYGRLVDPVADKLLLAAALVPLYLLTRRSADLAGIPVYDTVPLWAVLVLLGRELLITVLRSVAARRGRVVAAMRSGKYKAFVQNLFLGGAMLWVIARTAGADPGGAGMDLLGWATAVTLSGAILLTVGSLVEYLAAFARVLERRRAS